MPETTEKKSAEVPKNVKSEELKKKIEEKKNK